MNLILTVPANVDFSEIVKEQVVSGVRLNTTYTGNDSLTIENILQSMRQKTSGKDVWIDLKGRQPRIESYAVDILRDREVHKITLTHPFKLDTPAEVLLDGGYMRGIVEEVDGRTLIIPSDIKRKEGLFFPQQGQIGIRPGTSLNILHPSFEIEGFFTKNDLAYLQAAQKRGMHKYMLSYVERTQDVLELFKIDPQAEAVLKIETPKGIDFVVNEYARLKKSLGRQLNLMTARGDLYLEIDMPDQIIDASKLILQADPNAIVASRLMASLKHFPEKSIECNDVTDLYFNMMLGYKQFMVGDELTTSETRLMEATALFGALTQKYEKNYPQRTVQPSPQPSSFGGYLRKKFWGGDGNLPDTLPNPKYHPKSNQLIDAYTEKTPRVDDPHRNGYSEGGS